MTCQLWQEAYCHSGEELEDLLLPSTESIIDCGDPDNVNNDWIEGSLDNNNIECVNGQSENETQVERLGEDVSFKWHPFGAFDYNRGYMVSDIFRTTVSTKQQRIYPCASSSNAISHAVSHNITKYIDRIGYRIPTKLAECLGEQISSTASFRESTVHTTTTSTAAPPPTTPKRGLKPRPLQRSLTPHFDCCPETYHDASTKNKWRPIQCFVSLTDNIQPNTGGFEACPGFHREFRTWVANGRRSRRRHRQDQQSMNIDSGRSRLDDSDDDDDACGDDIPRQSHQTTRRPTKPQQLRQRTRSQQQQKQHKPPLCVGEYTHVSPSLDPDIMQRMQHIPVRSGSAVFWDNRIPHGNSYRNDPPLIDGDDLLCGARVRDDTSGSSISTRSGSSSMLPLGTSGARAVVYCSFLPDVEVNRCFVARQLDDWRMKRPPTVGDRWIRQCNNDEEGSVSIRDDGVGNATSTRVDNLNGMTTESPILTELGKRLLGLVDWPHHDGVID